MVTVITYIKICHAGNLWNLGRSRCEAFFSFLFFHLRVSWSVWCWDDISRSFGPCGLCDGVNEHLRFFAVFLKKKKKVEGPTADLLGEVALVGERFYYVKGVLGLQNFFSMCQVKNRINVNTRMQVFPALHCNKTSTVYSRYLLVIMLCLISIYCIRTTQTFLWHHP